MCAGAPGQWMYVLFPVSVPRRTVFLGMFKVYAKKGDLFLQKVFLRWAAFGAQRVLCHTNGCCPVVAAATTGKGGPPCKCAQFCKRKKEGFPDSGTSLRETECRRLPFRGFLSVFGENTFVYLLPPPPPSETSPWPCYCDYFLAFLSRFLVLLSYCLEL